MAFYNIVSEFITIAGIASRVVFTEKRMVMLDGPDCCCLHGLYNTKKHAVIKRTQEDGSIMWAKIYSDKPIGPFKVDDGVKLTSQIYC